MTMTEQRVLFLCTGNSCRSQMAEGLLRNMAGDRYEVASAGTTPSAEVYPPAVAVMAELGLDISGGVPKAIDDLADLNFDFVITVCDNANENCPYLPGQFERLHWPFADPAKTVGTEEEKLAVCRRVRDEIRAKLEEWLEEQAAGANDLPTREDAAVGHAIKRDKEGRPCQILQVWLPCDLVETLDALAERKGESLAALLREVLSVYAQSEQ